MKNNFYKTKYKNGYKRLKKVIWAGASSGVVTGLILMGSTNTALADTIENVQPAYTEQAAVPPMHMMRRWNSASKVSSLATSLGLDPTEVTQELKSGKGLKQILQDHDIVPEELQKAFDGRKSNNKRLWKQNKNTL